MSIANVTSRAAAVEQCAAYLEELASTYYGEDLFRPIPDERKAKDGVAADLLREMLPRFARTLRERFTTDPDNNAPAPPSASTKPAPFIATETLAADLIDEIADKKLTRAQRTELIRRTTELVRIRTQCMLTYGPAELARIADSAHLTIEQTRAVLAFAGGHFVAADDLESIWSQRP